MTDKIFRITWPCENCKVVHALEGDVFSILAKAKYLLENNQKVLAISDSVFERELELDQAELAQSMQNFITGLFR